MMKPFRRVAFVTRYIVIVLFLLIAGCAAPGRSTTVPATSTASSATAPVQSTASAATSTTQVPASSVTTSVVTVINTPPGSSSTVASTTVNLTTVNLSPTTTPTYSFTTVAHAPGVPPVITHPLQGFDDCVSCHFYPSTGTKTIIDSNHACDTCHISMQGWNHGTPMNSACGICHIPAS